MKDLSTRLSILAVMFIFLMIPEVSSAQDCTKKLDNWNKMGTFPAGVIDDYVECTETAETALEELENEIRELLEKRNAVISTLGTSYNALVTHYQSEDLDDKGDEYKKKKNMLTKKHKKMRL